MYDLEHRILLGQLHASIRRLQGVYVAGGALTSIFTSRPINDFDLYFTSDALMQKALTAVKKDAGEGTIETDCAYSFKLDGKRYQIIKIYTGTPKDVIAKFDFTVCQAAWSEQDKFTFGDGFFHHLAQRRLVVNVGTEFPISTLFRVRKYLRRGFTLSGIESIKLGLAIQKLEIKTTKELRRQIMGIDTLFLRELTDALKSDEEKGYEFNEFMALLDEWLSHKLVLEEEENG